MKTRSTPIDSGKRTLALVLAWLLIATACGNNLPDPTITGTPIEEESNDAPEEVLAEDEAQEAGEHEDSSASEAVQEEDAAEDEPDQTQSTCGPSADTQRIGSGTFVLDTIESTDCDSAANRDGSDGTKREMFIDQKRAAFPDNVLTNPSECVGPSLFIDGRDGWNNQGIAAQGTLFATPMYSSYVANEILTFSPEDEFVPAIGAIVNSLNERERSGFEIVEVFSTEVPFAGGSEKLYRYRFEFNSDLPEDDFRFDPLVWSNLLVSQEPSVHARPNYLFTLAPGSQHSPFNEPVPAHAADLAVSNPTIESETTVAVLDSDWNHGSSDPMSLWAGHMTFVAGIVEQLATGSAIKTVDFAAGETFTQESITEDGPEPFKPGGRPFLTDWAFLQLFSNSDSPLFVDGPSDGVDYHVVNLSAGAYACAVPAGAPSEYAPPPGIVAAATLMQERGKLLIAAAGNDGLPAQDGNSFWPAALADESAFQDTVLAVQALDSAGQITDFSNKGPSSSVCAPGSDIRSHYPRGEYAYAEGTMIGQFDGAAIWSGTSFATPHVTAQYVRIVAEQGLDPTDPGERVVALDQLRALFPCAAPEGE